MKLYFNSNFELVKESGTDSYKGSSGYDELYVLLNLESYSKLVNSGGSIYPTYAAKLPSGVITPEVASWDIPTDTEMLDDVQYMYWGTTLIDRVLSEAGLVQLTINFKINNGTTTKTLRSCKAILNVVDTIVSDNNVIWTDGESAALDDFKAIIDGYSGSLSQKADLHGNEGVYFGASLFKSNEYDNADGSPLFTYDGGIKAGFNLIPAGSQMLGTSVKPWPYVYADTLILSQTPTGDMEATTKNYVDLHDSLNLDAARSYSYSNLATAEAYTDTNFKNAKAYTKTFGKSLTMDSETYVLNLTDADGNVLSSVDLPLETMVVNAEYSGGTITLRLKNGQTLTISIADLVSGLASTVYVDTQRREVEEELEDKADDSAVVHLNGSTEAITTSLEFWGSSCFKTGCFKISANGTPYYGCATFNYTKSKSIAIDIQNKSGTMALLDDIPEAMTDDDLNEILEVFA